MDTKQWFNSIFEPQRLFLISEIAKRMAYCFSDRKLPRPKYTLHNDDDRHSVLLGQFKTKQ